MRVVRWPVGRRRYSVGVAVRVGERNVLTATVNSRCAMVERGVKCALEKISTRSERE